MRWTPTARARPHSGAVLGSLRAVSHPSSVSSADGLPPRPVLRIRRGLGLLGASSDIAVATINDNQKNPAAPRFWRAISESAPVSGLGRMAHRQHRGDVRLPHPWHRNRIRRLPACNRQHCVLCAI